MDDLELLSGVQFDYSMQAIDHSFIHLVNRLSLYVLIYTHQSGYLHLSSSQLFLPITAI